LIVTRVRSPTATELETVAPCRDLFCAADIVTDSDNSPAMKKKMMNRIILTWEVKWCLSNMRPEKSNLSRLG
jgi:hypothetical protein